jgi:hypothetical protein
MIPPKPGEHKPLPPARWGLVIFLKRVKEFIVMPEKGSYRVLVSPMNRQATTSFRTAWSKPGDQDKAPGLHRTSKHISVSQAICVFRQKVQYGPVMPEIVDTFGLPFRDIDNHEAKPNHFAAQPLLCLCQGCRRNIKHCDVREALGQEGIRETGGARTNIDNVCVWRETARPDQA